MNNLQKAQENKVIDYSFSYETLPISIDDCIKGQANLQDGQYHGTFTCKLKDGELGVESLIVFDKSFEDLIAQTIKDTEERIVGKIENLESPKYSYLVAIGEYHSEVKKQITNLIKS